MATRGGSLVGLLRTAARLDRTQSDPIVSARNAIGVALPLAIGALAGNVAYGLPSTIGALQTAFADRPGPYRLRLLRMLATATAAALTSGLAVACSRSDAASVLLLLVLGFGAGLLLTGGPAATQVGVAATAAALVLGHRPEPASVAPHVALLVLAGGAGQVLLAIAAWPLGRHRPERLALAGLYRELVGVAQRPPGTHVGPPAGDTVTGVRLVLYGLGHDHGPSVEAYRVLLDEAERIRRELIVLAGQAERLRGAGRTAPETAIRTGLTESARVLGELAAALEDGRRTDPAVLDPVRTAIDAQLSVLDAAAGADLTARAAAARLRSLAGQLRAAVETARAGASEGRSGEEPDVYGVRRLRAPIAILRANLTPSSAVLRHALRVALLVAGSDLLVRLGGVDRGYWVPLTVLVVLRPDFASTFQRSSMRVAGTIVGLLLATALVHWIPGGQWYQVVLVALFFFGMRLAGPGNLALSAVALAGLVVVLLAIDGIAPHATVQLRAEDTLIGGVLALAAMLLSPTWERDLVPSRLGDLLAAYRNYLAAVSDPDSDLARRQRTRAASRLARTNARASVDRARSEPVRGEAQVELGEAVLAHSHRFIHAMLTVDAVRTTVHRAGRIDELDGFMVAAAAVLTSCERAIRGGTPPRSVPKLRPLQESLARVLAADPLSDPATASALLDASDRITNSLDTLVNELRRQLA
ncbi:FUSC family protein [Jatrophihabitans cynanchi]|uniref:FUSC family protein n=1 Tax=Jatrophihabitans cynanchi TaxID=2944128 RepID=A0ABY7JYB9_9ACTN|nr:FUSC family protein [Jatrophihabitans sp. SB3-54]WAX57564.1 FUSC family protein [Jatrophihabitans sp. SB3-54]